MAEIHLTIHRHGEGDAPTVDFETVRKVVAAIEALGLHAEMTDTGAVVFTSPAPHPGRNRRE